MRNIIIGVVIILVIAGAIMMFRGSGPEENSTGLLVGDNAVNVSEQGVGESEATVSMVVLEGKGYVVVHEVVSGKPGKILGVSALLPSGQSNNVRVVLSEPMVENKSYTAMLHLDNGDGVFDASTDQPAKNNDVDGGIMMEFQAEIGGGGDSISI